MRAACPPPIGHGQEAEVIVTPSAVPHPGGDGAAAALAGPAAPGLRRGSMHPMLRRGMLLLPPAALMARPALAAAGGYAFRVIRRGEAVGTHTVRFATRGAERIATSELVIAPRVFGVVVYRYEHRYEEATENGRFRRVASRLNRNGRIVEVRGEAVADAVVLDGTEGPQRLPADAAPLSWWEMRRMGDRVPLFGTTTGREMALAWQTRRAAAGGPEFACSGAVTATVSFDAAGRWVGFSARGEDGHDIAYEPA